MNKVSSTSYEDRLQRVTSYIYENLDQDIDLDRLAEIACMSPYHWHRIYRAVYGETITVTVKRLRLSRAAADISNTSMPIQEIAKRSGYKNLQSFTRLFKLAYGMPPATYRNVGGHTDYQPPYNQERTEMHDITIKELPTRRVACIGHKGSYMNIGNAFDQMFGAIGNRQLDWSKLWTAGIFYDDPMACPEPELRSKAALIVDAEFDITPPLEEGTIAGGKYAVLRHKGPYADMQKAYQWFYGEWLINSGYEAADAPVFELYVNNPRDTKPADLLTDIHLPLAG